MQHAVSVLLRRYLVYLAHKLGKTMDTAYHMPQADKLMLADKFIKKTKQLNGPEYRCVAHACVMG